MPPIIAGVRSRLGKVPARLLGLKVVAAIASDSRHILRKLFGHQPRFRPQHIADLFKPRAKGIVEQVGVALRGLNLRVAEELADHRQRHAAGNEQRRKGVAQVMDADAGQFGLVPHIVPEPLDVLKRLAFGIAGKHPFAIPGHAQPEHAMQRGGGGADRRAAPP